MIDIHVVLTPEMLGIGLMFGILVIIIYLSYKGIFHD